MSLFHICGILLLILQKTICEEVCMDGNCVCDNDKATCSGIAISDIQVPDDIRHVHLYIQKGEQVLKETTFRVNNGWGHVDSIEINYDFSSDAQPLLIERQTFFHLKNLTSLAMHSKWISLNAGVLDGLGNLVILDLSDCITATLENIFSWLYQAYLPRLRKLNLAGLQSYYISTFDIDYSFLRMVEGANKERNITFLDLSRTRIGTLDFGPINALGFCEMLHTINFTETSIQIASNFLYAKKCSSLKVAILNKLFFPRLLSLLTPENTDFFCAVCSFYFDIEHIYAEGVFSSVETIVNNTIMDLTKCPFSTKTVYLFNNKLKFINITVLLHQKTAGNVRYVNASNNLLEYVSPNVVEPCPNYEVFDISNNNLGYMASTYPDDFSLLLTDKKKLKYFSIANNSLEHIPEDMFQWAPNLEHLDLSYNRMSSISFRIQHMTKLQVLKVNNNHIQVLDSATMHVLQSLQINSTNITIDMRSNPFVCNCQTQDFNKWVVENVESNLLFQEGPNEYQCKYNGETVDLNRNTLERVDSECLWEEQKKIIITSASIVGSGLVFTVICIFIYKHFKKRRDQYKYTVSLIKEGKYPSKHLAFLSFCSHDEQIVTQYILDKLQDTLRDIISTERDLVCTGDTQFRPGYPIGEEIINCIRQSAVTILVVSNAFCQNITWCQREVQEAYDQNKPIILLMLEKVSPDAMGPVLQRLFAKYTHASWKAGDHNNGGHMEPDWPVFGQSIIALAAQQLFKHKKKTFDQNANRNNETHDNEQNSEVEPSIPNDSSESNHTAYVQNLAEDSATSEEINGNNADPENITLDL